MSRAAAPVAVETTEDGGVNASIGAAAEMNSSRKVVMVVAAIMVSICTNQATINFSF